MNKPIGGRGKKAPYETTHVRIPVDLKAQVEKLVEDYRNNELVIPDRIGNKIPEKIKTNYGEFLQEMIQAFKDSNLQVVELNEESIDKKLHLNLEQSIELANNLLATRATKKEVVNKLLTALFGIEVKL